ncbi:ABC transporter ATP-binding protein [Gorillibacterium timonense]|uniref:ABC transporter ATP-binding protein n=1 Tax=Gorillibacterium timonense TaxID=1689269 RepID=UPI00071DA070|nr:oligopeptide/dipeptide ABC transporter ATP-binding protein [Gorillibacterium timonense]
MAEQKYILEVQDMKKHFAIGNKKLKAVDGITFGVRKGETLGIVGESGCGKSTAGKTIIGLYGITAGDVLYNGKSIKNMNPKDRRNYTRSMQMVFQDPYASLNPRMTVGDVIAEGIDIHGLVKNRRERAERVHSLLEAVGLNSEHAGRFPHEFSGGQRQRIGIARALAIEPEFIVADEPISALDVSVQAQVINLFQKLQKERGLTYLFIAHDLAMVKHISDRIGVMYLGKMMELTTSAKLYAKPLHPYTQSLLSAIPIPDPEVERTRERIILQGEVPSPLNPPSGCPFRTRCPHAMDVCAKEMPPMKEIEEGHFAACYLY